MLIQIYCEFKEKIGKKMFGEMDKEDILSEEEFRRTVLKEKRVEDEAVGKMFEKYSILRKNSEEKVEKVIKVRAVMGLVFEYSLVDLKELYRLG
jgi:hypothetical protein